MPESHPVSEQLREALRGMPESTVAVCAEYQATGSAEALRQAVCRVIEYHLPEKPAIPIEEMPGSTRLVADLKGDSLAMAEMAFVFDDVFGMKLPYDGLAKVATLDDLMALIRSELKPKPAAGA